MEVARERVRGGRPLPGARAVQPRRELRVAPHQAPAARAHRRREVRLQRALRPARLAGGRGLRPGAAPAHNEPLTGSWMAPKESQRTARTLQLNKRPTGV